MLCRHTLDLSHDVAATDITSATHEFVTDKWGIYSTHMFTDEVSKT